MADNIIGASTRDAMEEKRQYEEAKAKRAPFENDFKMAAAYCAPQDYAKWLNPQPPFNVGADAVRRFAFDNTGVLSLPKYGAIMQRLATPDGQRWHRLRATNTKLMQQYRVRKYFDDLTDVLFKVRYNPYASFVQATGELYRGLGVYGSGPIRVGWRKARYGIGAGMAYKAIPMRDFFALFDDDGRLYKTYVRFWLTAPMFKRKWPNETAPKSIAAELQKGEKASNDQYFEFAHTVYPREDYDAYALDARRHTHCSQYLAVQDGEFVGKEGGFAGNPYLMPRTASDAGSDYGLSPAMIAFPALGTASATKKTMLKAGHQAVEPTVLAPDDGVLTGKVDMRPGRVIYGAVTKEGNRLVQPFNSGSNYQVGEAVLQDERHDIQDSFFVTLFQILMEDKDMTATEVLERVSEKVSLVAPTMGRVQTDWLGPDIDREIATVAENAPEMLPEMPGELIEAKGEYETVYTSPLAKSLYAEEDTGFTRMYNMALEAAKATGDSSPLDHFNLDVAIPEMAEHQNVPTRWMATPDDIAAKRADKQKQQQTEQLVKAGPALASVANAAAKTGGGSPAIKGAM